MSKQKVPLLDLRIQYQAIKDRILEDLHEIMESQQFILGSPVSKLEEEISRYCRTEHAVGVNSGSDALLLSMMAMDIKTGDMVITTPYTFFATCGSICRLGATPVFVDISHKTFNMDPQELENLLLSMPV